MISNYKVQLTVLVLLLVILARSECRLLEITSKNIPNVLKTQPKTLIIYHHPDCPYSQSFTRRFAKIHQEPSFADHTIGMMDCSQEQYLCKHHNITDYPALAWVAENGQQEFVDPYLYLGDLDDNYQKDQYVAAKIASFLKQDPYFVLVLFEEIGMPVPQSDKPINHKHFNRFFYLSEGRVSQYLLGLVKNKPGCWLFLQQTPSSLDLTRFSCGSTYQSSSQIITSIQSILDKKEKKEDTSLIDNSDYLNDTKMGYKEMVYWLEHFNLQMEITTYSKISMCGYLYFWANQCQHCDYELDMKLIKRMIETSYRKYPKTHSIHLKKSLHSYDIYTNSISFLEVLQKMGNLKLSENSSQIDKHFLIPNVYALCFSTYDNRNLDTTVTFSLYKLEKIITAHNVANFVNNVIEHQIMKVRQPEEKRQGRRQGDRREQEL